MTWTEILALRSELFKKAVKVAKQNCSLRAQRSRGATLLVHDKDGKALAASYDYPFPSRAADLKGIIEKVKRIHPQAHTLLIQVGVDSATGNRGFVAGKVKEWTGSASAPFYTYGEDGGPGSWLCAS